MARSRRRYPASPASQVGVRCPAREDAHVVREDDDDHREPSARTSVADVPRGGWPLLIDGLRLVRSEALDACWPSCGPLKLACCQMISAFSGMSDGRYASLRDSGQASVAHLIFCVVASRCDEQHVMTERRQNLTNAPAPRGSLHGAHRSPIRRLDEYLARAVSTGIRCPPALRDVVFCATEQRRSRSCRQRSTSK